MTVFDSHLGSLQKAADYNREDTVPPAAVMLTQCRSLASYLCRMRFPSRKTGERHRVSAMPVN